MATPRSAAGTSPADVRLKLANGEQSDDTFAGVRVARKPGLNI
ncbi:MAG: hypothetical protein WC054_13585 [Candidatus Nanopelagicales bacterium]